MLMTSFLTSLIAGIVTGCIYAVIAAGFSLCFKAGGALDFAQSNLMVLGSYVAVSVIAAGNPIVGLLAACLIATVVSGGGYLLGFRRFTSMDPITISFVTMGASFIIASVTDLIWHGTIYVYQFPGLATKVFTAYGAEFTALDLFIVCSSVTLICAIEAYFRFTQVGVQLRACSDSPSLAARSGIDVNKYYAIAWAIAGLLAAFSGCLLAATGSVSETLGDTALVAFPAAVLGGFGSVPGALLGGLALGLIDQFVVAYVSPTAGAACSYLVMLIVLIVRPVGLFGDRRLVRS
jgi:branched-chain amino acid transport system permease protein